MTEAAFRSTADWQAADAAHYLHPFTDFKSLAAKGSRVIVSADNIYLRDSEGENTNVPTPVRDRKSVVLGH